MNATAVTATRVGRSMRKASKYAPVLAPVDAVTQIAECIKFCSAQGTAREEIRAKRDVAIHSLQSQKEMILSYFHLRFGERAEVLEKFYVILDAGVQAKNETMLRTACQGIVGTVKDNPLSDFAGFKSSMASGQLRLEL